MTFFTFSAFYQENILFELAHVIHAMKVMQNGVPCK